MLSFFCSWKIASQYLSVKIVKRRKWRAQELSLSYIIIWNCNRAGLLKMAAIHPNLLLTNILVLLVLLPWPLLETILYQIGKKIVQTSRGDILNRRLSIFLLEEVLTLKEEIPVVLESLKPFELIDTSHLETSLPLSLRKLPSLIQFDVFKSTDFPRFPNLT